MGETTPVHTPGPWSVASNGFCVFTDAFAEARGVAHCGMAARSEVEIAANARLIAAAPELLAACELAIRNGWLASSMIVAKSNCRGSDFSETDRSLAAVYAALESAICKANGKTIGGAE